MSDWTEQEREAYYEQERLDAEHAAAEDQAMTDREQELLAALKVECTCRVIEKCDRCEAIDAIASADASASRAVDLPRQDVPPICPLCYVTLTYGGWRGSKDCSKWVCQSCRRSLEITSFVPSEERKALVQALSQVDSVGGLVADPSRAVSPDQQAEHEPNCESRTCSVCKQWFRHAATVNSHIHQPFPCNCRLAALSPQEPR